MAQSKFRWLEMNCERAWSGRRIQLASLILFLPCLRTALATEPSATQPVTHRVLLVEYDHGHSRLMQIAPDGKLEWEQKLPSLTVMFQRLTGGHIICPHGGQPAGVTELDADHKPFWEYVSHAPEVLGGERLANGHTLVGEEGPCRAVEVDAKGEIISSVNLPATGETHHQVRRIHQLANGNILAAHEGDGAVREVEPNGKVVWEYKGVENVFEALRLPGGNTLIGCGTQKRVIEVTPEGKTVWELKSEDVPELNLTWITSLQVLPNGHYVIANFLRGQEGKGAHAFEITKEKTVVWRFADHQMVKSLTMLQVLDSQ